MATNTKFGKIVWAKVKGSSPWPAKGVDSIASIKRPSKKGNWHFVRFYGSNDHAWIDYETHIWPYKEYRKRFGDKDKVPQTFREALLEADKEYETLGPEDLPAADHELLLSEMAPQKLTKPAGAVKRGRPPAADKNFFVDPDNKPAAVKRKNSTQPRREPPAKKPVETESSANGEGGSSNSKDESKDLKQTGQTTVSSLPSLIRSPKLSPRTHVSPRRTEIKAQVYDFDDAVLSSQLLSNKKNIKVTSSRIGFIGLGTIGMAMVRNLIKHGHKVSVWNKTVSKCTEIADVDVKVYDSPAQLVSACDIVLACLADPFAVKEVLFCQNGVMESMGPGKAFVDLTTVDVETASDAECQIKRAGGEYLEAPVSGTKKDAVNGTLLIMAAGNEDLYKRCTSCFQAISKKSYYLGSVGHGTRMVLSLSLINASINCAVAEGMALADRVGIKHADLLDVLSNSACNSQLVSTTSKAIIAKNFTSQLSLKHIQKDMKFAIEMADMYDQPLHMAASVNEMYKRGKSLGLSNLDMSAVYKATSK